MHSINVDLFKTPEIIPTNVNEVLNRVLGSETNRPKQFDTQLLKFCNSELNKIGYEINYDLSGIPFNLKKMSKDKSEISYILISEYPGSPKLDTIASDKWSALRNKVYYQGKDDEMILVETPEQYPLNWQKIIGVNKTVTEITVVENISKYFHYIFNEIKWEYNQLNNVEKDALSESEFNNIKTYFKNNSQPLIVNQ